MSTPGELWLTKQIIAGQRPLPVADSEEEQELRCEIRGVGFAPRELELRALYYFATEQWKKYESLDFDTVLLRRAYATVDERLRRLIAKSARRNGRVEWLSAAVGGQRLVRIEQMSESEWTISIQLLGSRQQWSELRRLAEVAPPKYAARILKAFAVPKLHPGSNDIAFFGQMRPLAHKWRDPELPSRLVRLSELPMVRFRASDASEAEAITRDSTVGREGRAAAEFILALYRWRWRSEIFVEEAPKTIRVAEFDIEVEG
jgi:hypothetical protein